jgi:hypothetical protein
VFQAPPGIPHRFPIPAFICRNCKQIDALMQYACGKKVPAHWLSALVPLEWQSQFTSRTAFWLTNGFVAWSGHAGSSRHGLSTRKLHHKTKIMCARFQSNRRMPYTVCSLPERDRPFVPVCEVAHQSHAPRGGCIIGKVSHYVSVRTIRVCPFVIELTGG